ncbi:hypothetical protein [Clostridium ihumii]|uniref:hypothetical protein n=1 Tax=Clostridium ihumii TaxID=1470356 RepID=UPI003D33EDC1
MRSIEQIEKDITLTRMLAFGVYSLAMKKKKKVVSTVALLSCEYNGLEYTVALAGDKAPALYKKVFKILAK